MPTWQGIPGKDRLIIDNAAGNIEPALTIQQREPSQPVLELQNAAGTVVVSANYDGTVAGTTPTIDAHLATKAYVDDAVLAAGAHDVLSATHTDTLTGAVLAGDLLVGNATPKWARLAKGAAATVLKAGAAVLEWGSVAFSELTGTLSNSQHGTLSGGDHSGTLSGNARVGVRVNSAGSTHTRRRINLIPGTNVQISHADDAGNEEVDVTISAPAPPLLDSTAHLDTTTETVVAGDIITGNATPKWSRLAKGAETYVLKAGASLVAWGQVAWGEITGKPSTYPPDAHNLLSASHGDTTAGTVVAGDLAVGDATPKWTRLAKGTATYVLKAGASVLAWGQVAFSELTGLLVTAQITDNAIDNTKIRDSAALTVIGRAANSAGDPADIAAIAESGAVLRESGSTVGFGTIATAGIADNAVSNAKLRDSAALSVVGRSVNSTGDPADIVASADATVLRRSGTSLAFGQVAFSELTGTITDTQHGSRAAGLHADSHARQHALDSAADHSGTLTDAQLASGVTQTGGASKIVKTDAAGRVRLGAAPDNGLDAATKAYVDELVFRPTNLAGLKLWLDANEISGLADGDPVAQWDDLSGQGNHATQGTAAKRPIYKVGILNGGPVVRLDGSNDWLATAAFATALTQPTYIVAVVKMDNAEDVAGYLWDGIAAGNRQLFQAEAAGTPDNYAAYAGADFNPAVALPKGAFRIFAVDFNTTNSTIYANGAVVATGGNVGTHTITGLTLGASFAATALLQGDMAEVLIINPTPTAAQRLRLNRYLSHKHAIALAG